MNATPTAISELRKALELEENPMRGVRIFTQQGCCGPSLQMSAVEGANSGDMQVNIEEINFFIAPAATDMVEGVTLDYGPNGFRLEGLRRNGGGCCG